MWLEVITWRRLLDWNRNLILVQALILYTNNFLNKARTHNNQKSGLYSNHKTKKITSHFITNQINRDYCIFYSRECINNCIYSCIITSRELELLFFFSFLLMFLSFFLQLVTWNCKKLTNSPSYQVLAMGKDLWQHLN